MQICAACWTSLSTKREALIAGCMRPSQAAAGMPAQGSWPAQLHMGAAASGLASCGNAPAAHAARSLVLLVLAGYQQLRQAWPDARKCRPAAQIPCIPARALAGVQLWYGQFGCKHVSLPGWLLQPPAGAGGPPDGPGRP